MKGKAEPGSICVVADHGEHGTNLVTFLQAQNVNVTSFESGRDFLQRAVMGHFDFFVLALAEPDIDIVDLILRVRMVTRAGLIVLSGRSGPDAFNAALSAGADMYFDTPVRLDQVMLAIKTVSQRMVSHTAREPAWEIVLTKSELRCSTGGVVKLTPLELQILLTLAARQPDGCDRKTLGNEVRIGKDAPERNLDAAIFRLRRKIETAIGHAAPVRTLHGLGYALAHQVSLV